MVVTCLPLGLVVLAASPSIYYFYGDESIESLDDVMIGDEVPEGKTKYGVFVRSGTYDLQDDDRIAIVDDAEICLSDEKLAEIMENMESYMVCASGTGKFVADSVNISTDREAFGGAAVEIMNIRSIYFEHPMSPYELNYEFKADTVIDKEFHANGVTIDPDVTVTLTSTDDRDFDNNGRLCAKNVEISGNLAIDGMTEDSIEMKELVINPDGTLKVCDGGSITAGDGAGIYICNGASFDGIELWQRDGDELIYAKQGEEFQFIYYSSESKWIGAIDGMIAGKLYLRYDRVYNEDDTYEGTAFIGEEEMAPFVYRDYTPGDEISLTVCPPSWYEGRSPIVDVHMASDPDASISLELTKQGNSYVTSYTPADASGVFFDIYWSQYDTILPGENEIMFDLNSFGSVGYEVQINGVATPDDNVVTYPDPMGNTRNKYILSRDTVESDTVSVVFAPAEDHEIAWFRYNGADHDSESILDEHGFSVNDGVFTFTLDKDNTFNDIIAIDVGADDDDHGGGDPYFEQNKYIVDFSTYTEQIEDVETVQGRVFEGNAELRPWEPNDYEAGDKLDFTMMLPDNRKGSTPIVEIEIPGDAPVVPQITAVPDKEDEFTFTFEPESEDGFVVRIWWSEFDKYSGREGDFMIDLDSDENGGVATVTPQFNDHAVDPSNAGHVKGIYTVGNIPDTANVEITPKDGWTVGEIEIEYEGYRDIFVPDGMDKPDEWKYFSELDWISGDETGATVAIPTDNDCDWIRVRVGYYPNGGPNPGDYPEEGRYRIEFDNIPMWDEEAQEMIGTAHVMIDGTEIQPGYEGDIDTSDPVRITLSLPDGRKTCEHVVVVEYPGSVRELSASGDSIPLMLTSNEGTIIRLFWSRYDMFMRDGDHVLVITDKEGNGSVDVSGVPESGTCVNPSNENEVKHLVPRETVEAGDSIVTFTPDTNNRLVAVELEEDFDNPPEMFVTEADDRFPDATLMPIDNRFSFVDGKWTFAVPVPDDDLGHQWRIRAIFEGEKAQPGEIRVNTAGLDVQYAFVKDGVTGPYVDLDGYITVDPDTDPDQVILKFDSDEQLYALRITHEYGNQKVSEVRKFAQENTVTLDRQQGWGLYLVDLADEGIMTNNEYRIRVFGSADYHPLVDLKEDTIYEYDIDSTITLDLGDADPYKVIARSNFANEVEVTKQSDGKYVFNPFNTAGFEILIYETEYDYEFSNFVPTMEENCFEYKMSYVDYAEGEFTQTNVFINMPDDSFRFMHSADGLVTRVCVSMNLAEFKLGINQGNELKAFAVYLNGDDITQSVVTAGGVTLTADQIAQLTELRFEFYHKKTYNITAAQVTGGSLTVADSAVEGSKVTVNAVPDIGYELDKIDLKGDESGYSLQLQGDSFTMPDEDVTLTATFKKIDYQINTSAADNGKVTAPKTANYGDEVTLSVTPYEGYELDTLSVKDSSDNDVTVANNKFTMPADDVTVTATFKAATYTVTVEQVAGGTITVDKASAQMGDTITVDVTVNVGYTLDKVLVDGHELTQATFSMPGKDVTVSAVFTANDYTVTVIQKSNGTTSVDKTTAHAGDTITITVTPDEGYEVDVIKVDDTAITSTVFIMPARNVTVEATYKKAVYTVTCEDAEGGTVSADKATANFGDEITVTVTPSSGYELGTIKVDGEAIEGNTFVMPAKNVKVTATFNAIGYRITCAECENGKVTASKETANVGDEITLTITPAEGYLVSKVIVDGNEITGNTFKMPAKDVTVEAVFVSAADLKGWYTDPVTGNRYYYKDGAPLKSWQTIGSKKYYFNKNTGVMTTGWKKFSNGKVYYFAKSTGGAVTGLKTLEGKKYYFDKNGVMQSGWKTISKKKYYFKLNSDKTRAPAYTGVAKKIGSYYYVFSAKSVMLKSGVKTIASTGDKYYLKSTGKAYTKKWYKKSGKWYYFGSNGKMVVGKSLKIGKKTYKFDKNGVCKNP